MSVYLTGKVFAGLQCCDKRIHSCLGGWDTRSQTSLTVPVLLVTKQGLLASVCFNTALSMEPDGINCRVFAFSFWTERRSQHFGPLANRFKWIRKSISYAWHTFRAESCRAALVLFPPQMHRFSMRYCAACQSSDCSTACLIRWTIPVFSAILDCHGENMPKTRRTWDNLCSYIGMFFVICILLLLEVNHVAALVLCSFLFGIFHRLTYG